MAEVVGLAASIAGLISLVQGCISATVATVEYAKDIRHADEELHEFGDRFREIKKALFSLQERLSYIDRHFGPQAASLSRDEVIALQKGGEGGDNLYVRAQAMLQGDSEFGKIEKKLKHIESTIKPAGLSRRGDVKRRLFWKWKKQDLKNDQNEILQRISLMRQCISDGDAELNYDTHFLVRDIRHEQQIVRTIELLNWICPEDSILRDALNPAPQEALDPSSNSFMSSNKIYKQWIQDASWQLNCYGAPGCGKVRGLEIPINASSEVLTMMSVERPGSSCGRRSATEACSRWDTCSVRLLP